jgi:hypothetical protein
MFTLKEIYDESGTKFRKGNTEALPEPPADELETESLIIGGAKRLVAGMTEAHLTCNNRRCRGARRCLGLNREDKSSSCAAPLTKQRVDMIAAIVAFQACLMAAQKRMHAIRQLEEEAKQKKEQDQRKRLSMQSSWN